MRRFILVQLPEPVNHSKFPTIAAITRERIRLSARRAAAGQKALGSTPRPHGFRAFTLADSNFARWAGDVGADSVALQARLQAHVSHVKPGRNSLDLLFEIALKSGFHLDLKFETRRVGKAEFFDLGQGSLMVCLERRVALETMRAIAEMRPLKAVFLDEAFAGDDQLKVNAIQTFKSAKPDDKGDVSMLQTV